MLPGPSFLQKRGVVTILLVTPLFLFAIFRFFPVLPNFSSSPDWYRSIFGLVQYYLSTLTGLLAFIIALLTRHGLGMSINARSIFLTFGFLASGSLLLISSLGIPYLLLGRPIHPAFVWSLFWSIPAAAFYFGLASIQWSSTAGQKIVRHRWWLLSINLGGLGLYLLFAFHAAAIIPPGDTMPLFLIALASMALLAWAAWRADVLSGFENAHLEQQLAMGLIFLIEAELCLAFGLPGSMSWVLHQPLILMAEAAILLPLLQSALQYRREKRQRSELTQLIVHDLKSPLTIVISGLDLLKQSHLGSLSPPQTHLVSNLEHCSQDVLRLVDDMLDVERLEEGVLTLHYTTADLVSVVQEQISELQILAEKHRQQLIFTAVEGLPPVHADKDLLRRVIHNLLSNALKFTPDGGQVQVEASVEPGYFVLKIADSGPGIPPKARERIFEKFAQLNTDSRRGKGLGLTFCKMVTEAHGGSLRVTDSAFGGALFTLSLPTGETIAAGFQKPNPPAYRLIWGK